MNNLKKINFTNFYLILLLITPFILQKIFSDNLTATNLLMVFLFLALSFLFLNNKSENFNENFNEKIVIPFLLLILLVLTFITQNYYLNYETIDWDISSYLVASSEVGRGYIPNETQWESKGPLFLYLYYFFSKIVNNNYILFKFLNDIILFSLVLILFFSTYLKTKKIIISFLSGIFLILLFSQAWAISAYSELYSLIFIGISFLIFENTKKSKKKYFLIGFLISLSTLINQGTVIFLLPYVFVILQKQLRNNVYKISSLFLGFIIPHLFFLSIYFVNNLLDIYFATYFEIPLGYAESNFANLYELKVFYRKFYEFNYYLYLSIALVTLFYLKRLIEEGKLKNLISFLNLNLIAGLTFYFLADHNYYHHLFFLLFFLCHLFKKIKNRNEIILVSFFIFISVGFSINEMYKVSYENLSNYQEVYNDYPLNNLSKTIDSYFDSDYEILALDYLIILEYLDKPNYSYIVHPSNHFEEFIVEILTDLNRLEPNHISFMLDSQPEVIICNPKMIIRGEPTKIDYYNCEVDDYFKNYKEIDTSSYEKDRNLNYYYDPYKKIKVFIKQNE